MMEKYFFDQNVFEFLKNYFFNVNPPVDPGRDEFTALSDKWKCSNGSDMYPPVSVQKCSISVRALLKPIISEFLFNSKQPSRYEPSKFEKMICFSEKNCH